MDLNLRCKKIENCSLPDLIVYSNTIAKGSTPERHGQMVSPHCTMAEVNRLTHNCVPYFVVAALLLPHTKTGIEGGRAAEERARWGRSGEAEGQWRDENPRVIVQD